MTGYIEKLNDLQAQYNDDARYWVNDDNVELNGTLVYGDNCYPPQPIEGYVGLVDEHDGGMIAYGPCEVMERLADKLNKLHIMEELMHA